MAVNVSFIMLSLLTLGVVCCVVEKIKAHTARWLSLITVVILMAYFAFSLFAADGENRFDLAEITVLARYSWIDFFNIEYALAIDYLSVILIFLTLFLAIICILVSWQEISFKVGFYYFKLLAAIAGIIGVFSAVDMFLFFFFWEVMLLPMTAIIAIWGHENRHFAAIKFFIFTQVSSLIMLVAIIAMAALHFQQTGKVSFFYPDWLVLDLPISISEWLMLGFFIAFAVKLPAVPVHSWLPDAHTQAPTAGSILLAGVLLKTGAYGLIRFVVQLFPQASVQFAPSAVLLAVVSVLYGAKMAFAQHDFKRLVAYSSISHMGFVMLAIFSFNAISYQGAILTLVAHGLSSAALFSLAGMIHRRIHSRSLADMGGFWQSAPLMGGFALTFAAAAFGMPGTANFVGEFLSLMGSFQVNPTASTFAALGIIFSAVYGIVLLQRSFHGEPIKVITDLSPREILILASLFALLLVIGFYPKLILDFIAVKNAMVG